MESECVYVHVGACVRVCIFAVLWNRSLSPAHMCFINPKLKQQPSWEATEQERASSMPACPLILTHIQTQERESGATNVPPVKHQLNKQW